MVHSVISMASPLLLAPCTFNINRSSYFTPATSKTSPKKGRVVASKATNSTRSGDPNVPNSNQDRGRHGKLDRRNVLIGLGSAGGLYGAVAGLGLDPNNPFAKANPIPLPDLSNCKSTAADELEGLNCCPPAATISEFMMPITPNITRTRRAAHNAAKDLDYVTKYQLAVERMKNLPEDDPRNFWRQAEVHCSYCDGSFLYAIPGAEKEIQVHSSWLFFPFHRWYLYFYEKILGTLIDDPTFALPFWNWDAPDGMSMPRIFEDLGQTSPLYDNYRNGRHRQSDFLFDFSYDPANPDYTHYDREKIINNNLTLMHKQMYTTDKCLFFGHPYRYGDAPNPGGGNIENVPHNLVHAWCGDPDWNREDMGRLYSSGRDPMFFAHHANVDRTWVLWKSLIGGEDIVDSDWRNSEFLFYDENKNLVRVKVGDCLDPAFLGYDYENVETPWTNSNYKPTPGKPAKRTKAEVTTTDFPATLDKTTSVKVPRPSATKRTTEEKARQEEVLVIKGIEFPGNQTVKFDVYVNDDADSPSGVDKSEFAGSFVHVPHRHSTNIKTNLHLAITQLLEDLEAEEDASVVVTLVPRSGQGPITIDGFTIELICPIIN